MKKGKPCPTCGRVLFDDQRLREHIPKCAGNHFIQIKKGKKVVKVKVSSHPAKNSEPTFKRRRAQVRKEKAVKVDLENMIVKNPFPNFDLKKALGIQVNIEPLLMPTCNQRK